MPNLEPTINQLTNQELLQELEKRMEEGTITAEFNNYAEEVPQASTGINRYFLIGLALPLMLYFA